MYGAYWCSHCFDQKQAFGKEAYQRIDYIECAKEGLNSQTALCKDRKVRSGGGSSSSSGRSSSRRRMEGPFVFLALLPLMVLLPPPPPPPPPPSYRSLAIPPGRSMVSSTQVRKHSMYWNLSSHLVLRINHSHTSHRKR